MFFRSTLKGFLCLSLFVLHSSSSDTHQKKTAYVGSEAELPCNQIIPEDKFLTSYIYWQIKVEDGYKVVTAYTTGQKQKPDSLFENRTKVDEKNFTIWISSMGISDSGTYECIVIIDGPAVTKYVDLSVVANFSKPVINIDVPPNACGPTLVTVSCSSYGGYPKPNMIGSINNTTIEWDYSYISDDKQLLNVTGTYKLNITENITVQCAIHNPSFQESTKTFGIPNKCPPPPPPPPPPLPYGIVIMSIMTLIFLVTLIALITFFRHPACKHLRFSTYTTSHQPVTRIEMMPQKCSGEIRGQAV